VSTTSDGYFHRRVGTVEESHQKRTKDGPAHTLEVPRLPGPGDVDWPAFFSALYRSGDDHVCCVEHEDRQWEGSDELLKRGFLLARDVLKPYLH
jgi:sugar phosphate isomerase/epimerase